MNLLWSLLYNCLSIPVAAGAFYPLIHTRLPPTVAALAMALSSVSVVFSSLALRLYRPPTITPTSSIPPRVGRQERQPHLRARPRIFGGGSTQQYSLIEPPAEITDYTDHASNLSSMALEPNSDSDEDANLSSLEQGELV
jgi:hypothetical protein